MKKRFITVLAIICLLCTFTSATQALAGTTVQGSLEESETLTVYETELNEYFSERKKLYTANATTFDTGRWETLRLWKDQLNITIQSADVTFSVNEVISSTSSEAKVRVYEWVWINYICNGYEKVEEMGYGVDHIIRLRKIGSDYQVISDSYYDIATDCEYGVAEDLAIFESEREVFEDMAAESVASELSLNTEEAIALAATTDRYVAKWAISYANQWFGGTGTEYSTTGYNPRYYHYGDSDCCNFVSQCLAAGGMTMVSGAWYADTVSGQTTPVQDTGYTHSSESWRYVPTFKNYWVGRGYYMTQVTSTSQAIPGNPIFWLKTDGQATNHNMLIVGKNSAGQILCNSHSYNVKNLIVDLSAKKYYTIDFAHNDVSDNEQTHTCSLCGVTENHDSRGEILFDEIWHYITCSGCGRTMSSGCHSMGILGYEGCSVCDYVEE